VLSIGCGVAALLPPELPPERPAGLAPVGAPVAEGVFAGSTVAAAGADAHPESPAKIPEIAVATRT